MITALSTPAAGRVILDGNTTIIKVQSSNGAGHYFRAKIYIDGALFDEQGWSRQDEYTAVKDLKKLYHAYFRPEFDPFFPDVLALTPGLSHMVQITIEEYNIDTGEMTDSLELPSFYILYSIKPENFNDEVKVSLMGMYAHVMVIPLNGRIAFPFYVNAAAENVSVELRSNFDTIIDEKSIYTNGKNVMYYHYNLSNSNLAQSIVYLTATVICGNESVSQIFRINRLPDFPIKEIAFRNNYGYYLFAYPDGEMEISNAFTKESFEDYQGREIDFEVNEEATYTINTGSLLNNEKAVMNMIANSLDSRLNIEGEWRAMGGRSKKQLEFKDRQHQYAENLSFSLKKGGNIANTGMIQVEGARPDIYITGYELAAPAGGYRTVNIFFELNNGFTTPTLIMKRRPSTESPWTNHAGGVISPRPLTLPLGHYLIRIDDGVNSLNISNTIEINL